jgi:divinyl protochlorophyllide a 8-vinyl-reductase
MTPGEPGARIGPNAITQMIAALDGVLGRDSTYALFSAVGIGGYLARPPAAMVPEGEVAALHRELRACLSPEQCERISVQAGRQTGNYLLERRIPRLAQGLLKPLPAAWASRLLCSAIRRHAWTFTGSGTLRIEHRPRLAFVLEGCPVCREMRANRPVCHYFAATFERLLCELVDAELKVSETRCVALGDRDCRFETRRQRLH